MKILKACIVLEMIVLLCLGWFVSSYSIMRSVGNSMLPEYGPDDYIIVKTRFDSVGVGDVVVFTAKDGSGDVNHITHRIIAMNDEGQIFTKGDNNTYVDPYETFIGDVYGIVVHRFQNEKGGFSDGVC